MSIHQPGGILNPLSSPWPFAQWGLDIVGPFPKSVGNKKYLLVGTNYFTKWVEAEPLANIRDVVAKDSFGRTLSLNLEFLMCSSWTTAFNSTARCLEDTVASWELLIGILLLFIPKGMDRRKL